MLCIRRLVHAHSLRLVTVMAIIGLSAPARLDALVITELMYHPAGDNPDAGIHGEEFIELFNEANVSINLGGCRFTRGISGASGEQDYTIPDGTTLASGAYLVLARDPAAMLARGVTNVIGPYGGNLKNSGERLTLVDTAGNTVVDFTYSDRGDWPAAGDGTGHSIVLDNPGEDPDRGRNWRLSQLKGGSPGASDIPVPQTLHLVWAPNNLTTEACATDCSRQKYFKGTQEPPSTWKNVTFNDSGWLTGCGGWGYEDNDDCTVLGNMRNHYVSVYARVSFDLTANQIAWMQSLILEVRYDDGFVAYLNGNANPVSRANVTGTPPAYNTLADPPAIDPTTLTTDLTSAISLLRAGVNVLALQAHNAAIDSSDLSLIPRLTAVIQPPAEGDDPARQIVINEIFADGSGTEWFELYNPTDQTISLNGVWLSNNEDNLAMQALPTSASVASKSFLQLRKGVDFSFSMITGASNGHIFLTAPSQSYVLTGYCFGPQRTGQSIGRYPDGAPDWHYMDSPTPGTANTRHRLSQIVVNEIMYHAPQGEEADYVELRNTGTSAINISGWEFAGIGYRFPDSTTLPVNGYAVVCDDKTVAAATYGLNVNTLFGNYHGSLSNGGEKLVLIDENDLVVDWVDFNDRPPWPVTPDGVGASLERRCVSDSFDQPSDWVGSLVGAPTPGAANRITDCTTLAAPPLVINEIMKHPHAELHDDAKTEFIEIYNNSDAPAVLTHCRLGGDVDFAFPDGYSIPARAYRVLSSDTPAGRAGSGGLYQVYPSLSDSNTLGPYTPELPNGGADIWLTGDDGRVIDGAHYTDDFPWPSLADGYGSVEGRGYSLQRRCASAASDAPANWEASPADAPTPGQANSGVTCTLPPTVIALSVTPAPVLATSTPTITATVWPYSGVLAARIQYFVDDPETTGEPISNLTMTAGANGVYTAILPTKAANSIVRYQIQLNTGSGYQTVSPRPAGDAYQWHAYFVDPQAFSTVPQFHLFISRADWQALFDYESPGRVIGTTINPNWDTQVPAVFVADGKVYDVTVRFQGSRWNRLGPYWYAPFSCPSYSSDGYVGVLSWRIRFPSYRNYDKMDIIDLQKQAGDRQQISFKMFELAGVPVPRASWACLRINGCAYNDYTFLLERPGNDLAKRHFGEIGDMFKSQGYVGDEGPFGWGDERLLVGPLNGYSQEERYEYTYDRQTLTWKNHPGDGQIDAAEVLIEGLNAARAQGPTAIRAFLAANFDVDLTLRYLATHNYVGTFDDMFQNHFLYRKASDGKWCMFPWDLDETLGGANSEYNAHWLRGANRSDIGNREGWWNHLKDAFFQAYEAEYDTMLLYLNNEVYPPDVMNSAIDQLAAQCGFNAAYYKDWIQSRHDWLNSNVVMPICQLDPPAANGTLGEFAIQGPAEAVLNRSTPYTIHATLQGSTNPVDVQACTQWTTSRPDIATIEAGRLKVQTANPPATIDITATITDATGLKTAVKTVWITTPTRTEIQLGPIVGGSDGLSPGTDSYIGINQLTGQFEPDHYYGPIGDGSTQPQPVPAPPGAGYDLIDEVFILNGDVAINQAGVSWGTANWTNPVDPFLAGSYDFILDNAEPGNAQPLRLYENGQLVEYTNGLGIHSSAGITFDLAAIAAHSGTVPLRFQAKFGVHPNCAGSVEGFALFSDDQSVLAAQRSGVRYVDDDAYVFDVPVPAAAKYLTLATGAAGDGNCDHGVFGNAILTAGVPTRFDLDGDYDIDRDDYEQFAECLSGPRITASSSCQNLDTDSDGDVDQDDFGMFQRNFTGPQ